MLELHHVTAAPNDPLIMCCHDRDPASIRDVEERIDDGFGIVFVQGRRRLVGQHDRRSHGQGPADCHALSLPAGEIVDAMMGQSVQAEVSEQILRAGIGILRPGRCVREGQ